MERELVMSGIGGQGVQLASSALAAAAFAEGLEVQLFGSYGGMMRGGATEAAVVFADGPLEAPPAVGAAWSVILLHDEHAEHARRCARAGSLVLVNSSIVGDAGVADDAVVLEVPATAIATELGHALGASLVMAGAYVAATGVVALSSLTAAVTDALPPYRAQHRARNEAAVAAGAAAVPSLVAAAWPAGARR